MNEFGGHSSAAAVDFCLLLLLSSLAVSCRLIGSNSAMCFCICKLFLLFHYICLLLFQVCVFSPGLPSDVLHRLDASIGTSFPRCICDLLNPNAGHLQAGRGGVLCFLNACFSLSVAVWPSLI